MSGSTDTDFEPPAAGADPAFNGTVRARAGDTATAPPHADRALRGSRSRKLEFESFAAAADHDGDRLVIPAAKAGQGRRGCTLPAALLPSAAEFRQALVTAPVISDPDADRATAGFEAALRRWWDRFTAMRVDAGTRSHAPGSPAGGGLQGRRTRLQEDAGTPQPHDRRVAAAGSGSAAAHAGDTLVGAVLTALSLDPEDGAPLPLLPHMATDLLRAAGPDRSPLQSAAVEAVLGDLGDLGAIAVTPPAPGERAGAANGVTLTPLGWWLWFALSTAGGARPHTLDELMAEDAEVLVDRAAGGAPFGERELGQWIQSRGPEQALPDLVEVYRRSDDCVHRSAVRAVTAAYALQARTCYEGLRTDADFGGRARSWLFDAGFAKHESLHPSDQLATLLDGLAASLRTGTYGGEGSGFYGASEPDLPDVFRTAAEADHPESRFVLGWFALYHPDQRIRSTARCARANLAGPDR